MYLISKQILAIGLPVVVVAATGVAVAYWSTSGSGTGTSTTATPAALVVTQTAAPSNMGPGVPAGSITVTVRNPGPGDVTVNQVVASIASVVKASGAPEGACDSTDYALANVVMGSGSAQVVAAGAEATFSGATLAFNNKTTNQDACKGATVNLSYAAS